MAWLPGYAYRKPLVLTGGASGAQTDFQLDIDIAYVAAKMQADFDDIRFTQNDGTTLVDAWLESKVDSASAKTWAEFPTTPANTVEQTYYMYYGKVVANYWDIAATFINGWDFEGDAVGAVPAGWTEDAAHGSFRVVAGKDVRLTHASGEASLNSNYAAITAITSSNDRVIEYDCTPRNASDYSYAPLIRDGAGHANDGIFMALRSGYFAYQTSGGWSNLQAFTKDQKYAVKIHGIDLANDQYDVDIDSVNRGTNIAFRATETQLTHINLEGGGSSTCLNDWDNIRVRKDAANPPTYAFGAEESAPTGAAPTSVFIGPFGGPLGGPIQ